MATRLWHLPLRLPPGLYFLEVGLTKQRADDQTAAQLHGMAAIAYPMVNKMSPQQVVSLLSASEIAVGVALVAVPFVPPMLAGLALLGYGAALNRLYFKVPGMRREGSLRPSQQGVVIAKDFWLTGTGAALVLDSLTSRRRC
jgi:hypothetical protein